MVIEDDVIAARTKRAQRGVYDLFIPRTRNLRRAGIGPHADGYLYSDPRRCGEPCGVESERVALDLLTYSKFRVTLIRWMGCFKLQVMVCNHTTFGNKG